MGNYEGEEVFTPFKSLLPMVDPNDFVIGGWDISGLNMAEAMERGKVRACSADADTPSWGRGCLVAGAGAGGERGHRHTMLMSTWVQCSQAWACSASLEQCWSSA